MNSCKSFDGLCSQDLVGRGHGTKLIGTKNCRAPLMETRCQRITVLDRTIRRVPFTFACHWRDDFASSRVIAVIELCAITLKESTVKVGCQVKAVFWVTITAPPRRESECWKTSELDQCGIDKQHTDLWAMYHADRKQRTAECRPPHLAQDDKWLCLCALASSNLH